MQAPGCGVGTSAELAARMQFGHYYLDTGESGLRLDVYGDSPAVVPDRDRSVGLERDLDPCAVADERLIHRVVEYLPEAMHQAPSVVRPDVHPGPLADCLQALEDCEVLRRVGVSRRPRHRPNLGAGRPLAPEHGRMCACEASAVGELHRRGAPNTRDPCKTVGVQEGRSDGNLDGTHAGCDGPV